MKVLSNSTLILTCVAGLAVSIAPSEATGSTFTYQGQLKHAGAPFDGMARFEFSLWDADRAGRDVAPAIRLDLDVTDGLFTAELDFGTTPFNGTDRWLEISVDTGRGSEVLSPRQKLTPAPYAFTALNTVGVDGHSLDGAGGGPEDAVYVDTNGNVGVGTTAPHTTLDVSGTVTSTGLRLTSAPSDGYVLTSDATGHGTWQAPSTGGDSLWSANRDDIYFSDGNVGIGTSTPETTLDVVGGLAVDAFQMGDRIPAGRVLTSDANGVGTWQALPSVADPVWGQSGTDIYYEGDVGIGTTNPQHALEVVGYDSALIKVHNTSVANEFAAVLGECDSPDCRAIKGVANTTNGDPAGVFGQSSSPYGMGVYGRNLAGGYGVYGEGDTADGGWAGYFSGRGYFSGDVGIGRSSPQAKLDVNGTIKMTGLQLGTSATTGHVLTANSSGVATWQAPPPGGGDFTLPVQETVDADNMAAFSITNSGSGNATHAIQGVISNAGSGDASAAHFSVQGSGTAVHAHNDNGSTTIYATNSGTGKVVYASSTSGPGGEFRSGQVGGYGVKGRATNTAANADTTGGWFESDGASGKAVYAKATGGTAKGVYVETTGAESYGVYTTSPYYGLYASGGLTAAKFYGKVFVKSRTSNSTVFQVNNDGITEVDVLQINGGSDLAEKFEVTEPVKPGMVVEIDPNHVGKLRVARGTYNQRVAGVISGANDVDAGMVLADLPGAENSMPVALTGRVWVYCDASSAAITPGVLLTTSDRPGYAMKVVEHGRAQGAVIGKAMSTLDQGETGMVLVLVNLQ